MEGDCYKLLDSFRDTKTAAAGAADSGGGTIGLAVWEGRRRRDLTRSEKKQ